MTRGLNVVIKYFFQLDNGTQQGSILVKSTKKSVIIDQGDSLCVCVRVQSSFCGPAARAPQLTQLLET